MKSKVTQILSIGIALAAASAVYAQNKVMTANVPFGFYMGSSPMAEGSYRVDELSHGGVVSLRSIASAKSLTTYNIAGKKVSEPARLVFHRYGDDYFLAEIWTGDTTAGLGLIPSPREKELAHNGAVSALAVIRLALK
jgi:hypothetical protein